MAKNLFIQLCEELHIPYTCSYTNRRFDEHPYKYTLWGLHRLLTEYGVESRGVRFDDKEIAFSKLKSPFIAQVSGDLVLVKSITADKVFYQWYDEIIDVSHEQFITIWSGISLLFYPTDNAGESHYEEHRHEEQIQAVKKWGTVGCITIIGGIAVIQHASQFSLFTFPLLILNIIGIYLGYLLLLHQLKISSNVADKLCNLLKHSTCTNLLDTSAAKAVYDITWSEIGSAYFCVNIVALLFFPDALPTLCLFGFAALGYTIWSLWYQRFRAHVWCSLCLMVQGILVLQAITSFLYIRYTSLLEGKLMGESFFLIIPLSYLATTFIFHFVQSLIAKVHQSEYWESNLRNFKLRKEVFDSLLKQGVHYEVEATSAICFGNPNASYRLTIFTNPYCNPCAELHARISSISLTDCYVEMFFASFGKKYDRVCLLMIAAYQQLSKERAWGLYEAWYAGGKSKNEAFFDGLELDDTTDDAKTEYNQHIEWHKQTGFTVTPTILVNGYRMPSTYNIEDLKNLILI